MNFKVNNFLVKADRVCDYITVVSSVSNLIDLFQRSVSVPRMNEDVVNNNRYYTHLKNKSLFRCLVLLIPLLGNIVVGLYDNVDRSKEREQLIRELKDKPLNMTVARDRFRDDKSFILASVRENCDTLHHVFPWFRRDKEIVLEAIIQNYQLIEIADPELKDDPDFMLQAFQVDSRTFSYASERLQTDRVFVIQAMTALSDKKSSLIGRELLADYEFMLEATRKFPGSIQYISELLIRDRSFMLKYLKLEPQQFSNYMIDYSNDKEMVKIVIEKEPDQMQWADVLLREDREFMLEAVRINPKVKEYAGESLINDPVFINAVTEIEKGRSSL